MPLKPPCSAVSRRDVLIVGGAASALFGLGSGCAILRGGTKHPVLDPSAAKLENDVLKVPLSELASIPSGDVLEIKWGGGKPDLLVTAGDTPGQWRVITARCTHEGCVVDWKPERREWDCACHGSRFATDGAVLEGPADTPLPVPVYSVDGDVLAINMVKMQNA